MINPYHNRDTTNRNVRLAERGARYIATITTSLGAFVWGQDLAARYLPLEWSATPYLCVATGLLAGAVMGFLTDFMFGNLLQRVAYDLLAARHPNVLKWQGDRYFHTLRRAESILFGLLLVALLGVDMYTTLIIRDPIADQARANATTDLALATDSISRAQGAAAAPIASQLRDLDARITAEERRIASANPGLQKLIRDDRNAWAITTLAKKKERATAAMRSERDKLTAAYNAALAGQSAALGETQKQIIADNDRIAAANQRNRNVMAGMYMAFTVGPKMLSILLRVLMVITFLAYSTDFHPDLTGDGIIDYRDVEEYYERARQKRHERKSPPHGGDKGGVGDDFDDIPRNPSFT